uniref:Uncharacterized protein n=1 Tax=Alexandrium catenella TaxID=2925 RepID=A0A7S1R853_ALECA|eukprot:CAMPEP_0171190346 /NCGR_PEP_ID=MMETSP0790-20130122/18810_1 /TAXON_ID=2925 /ORGANISM="Alexandrium catenella, Strain OF101" /LENGTH=121 /DNA_ID=CAMNT_0011655477 /DNA_START=418 /DNA_END=783 /DNA_ORIENTATION=+
MSASTSAAVALLGLVLRVSATAPADGAAGALEALALTGESRGEAASEAASDVAAEAGAVRATRTDGEVPGLGLFRAVVPVATGRAVCGKRACPVAHTLEVRQGLKARPARPEAEARCRSGT